MIELIVFNVSKVIILIIQAHQNIKCHKENISNISASTYSIGSYNGGSSKILNVQFEVILIG